MREEALQIAVGLLQLTAALSDVFPPLKGIASGALHVVQLVRVCFRPFSIDYSGK